MLIHVASETGPQLERKHKRFLASVAILAVSLLASAPEAWAQLPDLIDNSVTRRVEESIAGQVARKIEQTVETSVQGAVDSAISNSVTKALGDTIDQVIGELRGVPREVTVEDNWRAVDHEWIALVPPGQLAALQNANIRIVESTPLQASGLMLVRVIVSDQDDNPGRAQQLLRGLGATAADRNHIYGVQTRLAPEEPDPSPVPQPASAKQRPRVGLIDTALNRKHPALKSASIVEKDFVDGKDARPTAHGTSIASLLIGAEKGHEGLLRNGQLIAASVFYQAESGATGATTSALVASLDWMAAQKVQIVNMSLAGPPNEVLGMMISRFSGQGMLVVAAVGNDGPASRPLYPAAFEPVVAVTAVDRKSQIYRWANQGPQVDVAAWGVASVVASDKGGYGEESGTSFAAPVVSAALAQLVADGTRTTSAAMASLMSSAEDLGAKGRDDVYGYGMVKAASARQ
ncbi:MAG: S8 family serine peptidase [Hyphomonadaceae bacterium]|nr:S8 family serine peptidase [Hyphomonadaceae bacterium]